MSEYIKERINNATGKRELIRIFLALEEDPMVRPDDKKKARDAFRKLLQVSHSDEAKAVVDNHIKPALHRMNNR